MNPIEKKAFFSDGNTCVVSQRAPDDYLSGPATVEYLNLPRRPEGHLAVGKIQ